MKTNSISSLWWYTVQFLQLFSDLKYDAVPINLLLLRDFQKFYQDKKLQKPITETLSGGIQTNCTKYLLKTNPLLKQTGNKSYTLIRANLYPLTQGLDGENFILLAHLRSEYLLVKEKLPDRKVIYLNSLPEKSIAKAEEQELLKRLERRLTDNIPNFFKSKQFAVWLKQKTVATQARIRKVHYLFDQYSIKRTIYGSTINEHGALITSYAQTRGIPTVNLQHGLLGKLGHLPVNADLNLVWSQADQDFLISEGVDSRKIRIIGPYFVQSLGQTGRSRYLKIMRKLKRLKVLVALQPLGVEANRKLIAELEGAKAAFPEWIAIFYKLHPEQRNILKYQNLIKQRHSYLVPHDSYSLHELLREADLVITPFSTVAYEAILLNKPVVFFGKQRYLYYLSGEAVFLNRHLPAKELFTRIINDNNYLNLIRNKTKLKSGVPALTNNQEIWRIIVELTG